MDVSRERSVFQALEVLQELLHPGCLRIYAQLLLLLGDHTAGTKPALRCWAEAMGSECHQQHPECPVSVPNPPWALLATHITPGWVQELLVTKTELTRRRGMGFFWWLKQQVLGTPSVRGQTHGPGDTPAAAQLLNWDLPSGAAFPGRTPSRRPPAPNLHPPQWDRPPNPPQSHQHPPARAGTLQQLPGRARRCWTHQGDPQMGSRWPGGAE